MWLALGLGAAVLQQPLPAQAYVALMAGQRARPLNGTFNNVPVLHSNQPEEVEGPGILISTTPGYSYASESGQPLRNAEYTFNGDFGMHLHHKYFPPNRRSISPSDRRDELTLAAILINPGVRPVHIRFMTGAVRNSFEAPYLANNLMGVKPLGPRPWNTGPGDATAVQMLRGRLDSRLADEITIPARSRIVLFQTQLPALGIANALLRGRSDGPFQMAVVAAKNPSSDADVLAVLDQGLLAPGRVYLSRINDIHNRLIFSRVGGVALGDAYQATISHDLQTEGPLHVPLTSTDRTNFGTRDVQVNPLASRMVDSSLDNVGTYGVRFDVTLNLRGSGPYELVMSHPTMIGGRPFTAFRGSIQIQTPAGLREVHVGLRSGQSLSLGQIDLVPGEVTPVRVSLVYPADATPGHLLSVVSASQLAVVQERERLQELARAGAATRPPQPPAAPPPEVTIAPAPLSDVPTPGPGTGPLVPPPQILRPASSPGWMQPPPPVPGSINRSPFAPSPLVSPLRSSSGRGFQGNTLVDRYREAVEAQQQFLRGQQAP
ncbi:MAG: hypothetical protein ER33_01785 [Cyanobium sp. CACIAM 14]|nr:MAG: hypothetical protein ER33_01785 [Cyanobium sp. CACIAM 14]